MDPGEDRRADVVILTAIRLEYDAVRTVDAGAVPGSAWEEVLGPSGLPVAFRRFTVENGRPLRVAVAVAPDMGATAAVNTLLPLVNELRPSCIAMCGVCAGRRDKGIRLGDVVAADRVFYHDTGKQRPDQVQQDLKTYNLRDDWKAVIEGMDAVARFRNETWFQTRPITTEWREHRALVALRDGTPKPWQAVDPTLGAGEWQRIIAALRERKLLGASGRELTDEGRRVVDELLFEHMDTLPDVSPTGTLDPFRLHVAPIGSGARVIEDERIWAFVSQAMRKTLSIEMEAAAIGELAHRQRQHQLEWVVMKGVMDFADHGRDDHFKEFAARASAESLLWFVREHVPTEPIAGFDDLLTSGALRLAPDQVPAPSALLNARYGVVPWHETGRSEILAELDAWVDEQSRSVSVRLLHAEGGIGKTRLAIEWVRRRRGQHNVAGFLVLSPDTRWLERLCGLSSPLIIIIDYAESRDDLVAVLQRVADFATSTGSSRRIRILLLARSVGDWWQALMQRHPSIRELPENRMPIRLSPLAATPADCEAVFAEALQAFAAHRQRLPVFPPSPTVFDDVRFQRVLYLHMAALACVEQSACARLQAPPAAEQRPANAGSLMDEILAHEERFWVRRANDRDRVAIAMPMARQLVAAATLRGGLTKDEARDILERLLERSRTDRDDALIGLLHDIYGGAVRGSYLPGLEPDLLGESMVLRVAAPPPGTSDPTDESWIDRVVFDSDKPSTLTKSFSVLGCASVTNSLATRPWIARLLRGKLTARAVVALRAAKAIGRQTATSTLGDVLAELLEQDGSASIALGVGPERRGRQQMGAQGHEDDQPHQRVAALPLLASTFVAPRAVTTKMVAIFDAVGNPQARAIDAIECQPSPAIGPGASVRPLLRRPQVQPLHRLWSQPCPRLAQCATGDRPATVCGRQRDIELARDRRDRQVTHHGHAQHQPHRLLRRESPPPDRRCAGSHERFIDPYRVEVLDQVRPGVCRELRRELERLRERLLDGCHDAQDDPRELLRIVVEPSTGIPDSRRGLSAI